MGLSLPTWVACLPWGCWWGCPCPLGRGVLSPGTCRMPWLLQNCSLWFISSCHLTPLPKAGLDSKRSACQYRRLKFDPWVRKIPQRREWQPTPVFFPGESHGQRSLVGYGLWGGKELDMTEQLTHRIYSQRVTSSEGCKLACVKGITENLLTSNTFQERGQNWGQRISFQTCDTYKQ